MSGYVCLCHLKANLTKKKRKKEKLTMQEKEQKEKEKVLCVVACTLLADSVYFIE